MSPARYVAALALAAGAIVTGCNQEAASVRVIGASPNAPPLDVTLTADDGHQTFVFPSVSYTTTTLYQPVSDDGNYHAAVHLANDPTGTVLGVSPGFHLDLGTNYTLVIAGVADSTNAAVSLRVLVEQEQFVVQGQTNVVVVNAVVDAPTVFVTVPDTQFTNMAVLRFGATTPFGLPVPSSRALEFAVTSNDAAVPIAARFTTTPLPQGADVFMVLGGSSALPPGEPGSLALLQIGPSGTIATVAPNPRIAEAAR
jgi:hypothetical protein